MQQTVFERMLTTNPDKLHHSAQKISLVASRRQPTPSGRYSIFYPPPAVPYFPFVAQAVFILITEDALTIVCLYKIHDGCGSLLQSLSMGLSSLIRTVISLGKIGFSCVFVKGVFLLLFLTFGK